MSRLLIGVILWLVVIPVAAQTPDLPIAQVAATAVCVGNGSVRVEFTPDVDGYYRLNGSGGDLPVGATDKLSAGFHTSLTANQIGNGEVWRDLHLEFWMRFYDAAPDTYAMQYMTVGSVTPANLDCFKQGLPVVDEQELPGQYGEWYTGPLFLDGRINPDSDYAIFADAAGVRVYRITDFANQRGEMITFLGIYDIQAAMSRPGSYAVFAAAEGYEAGIGRTANGDLMAFIRRGSSYTTYLINWEAL